MIFIYVSLVCVYHWLDRCYSHLLEKINEWFSGVKIHRQKNFLKLPFRFLLAIPSSMFSVYFTVCLRAIIAHLVPDRDKGSMKFSFCFDRFVLLNCLGKAFSFVAFIQNLDVVVGTIACTEIYRASISVFSGLVFIFATVTRVLALILIM